MDVNDEVYTEARLVRIDDIITYSFCKITNITTALCARGSFTLKIILPEIKDDRVVLCYIVSGPLSAQPCIQARHAGASIEPAHV